ncbi:MAG: OmpA family protein [bacterium]|jgi:peptidoglycan-associated lipoprotein|nr:OmpA family protein [bacterium]
MKNGSLKRFSLVLVLCALALVVLGGCSKKPPVVTEVPVEQAPVEVVQAPPKAEPEAPKGPDYANLDPSKYGIEDVFYGYDKYDLDDVSMGVLTKNARILKEAGVTLVVAGHCDERGTIEYNLALGEKRAKSARDYLVSLGVPAGNLRVTSYGESRPFTNGHGENDWAQNRRAHFERP